MQIEQAIITLELVKVLFDLLDTNCVNEKQYLNLQERVQEIGRMLGGWKNHSNEQKESALDSWIRGHTERAEAEP